MPIWQLFMKLKIMTMIKKFNMVLVNLYFNIIDSSSISIVVIPSISINYEDG